MGSTSFGVLHLSFLIRQHHMTVASAGRSVALCIGVASLVGILIGGPVAERISRGRPTLGFAAALVAVATMAVAVAILSPATGPALIGLALFGSLFMSYLGPCFSTVLDDTPPQLRGVSISIVMLVANLIGGWRRGPVLVGFISDHVGGSQALRWGLVTVISEFLGTAILLLLRVPSSGSAAGASRSRPSRAP